MPKAIQYTILFLVCSGVTLISAGYSYHTKYNPHDLVDQGSGFYGDGWVEDGASLYLNDLLPIGNKLQIYSSDWHPPGLSGAELGLSLCGEEISKIIIEPSNKYSISLSGSCEPKVLRFNFKAPFIPSEQDQRKLGVKIEFLEIDSRLGFPIVSLSLFLTLFIPIFLLALTTYRVSQYLPLIFSLFVIILAGILIAIQSELDLTKIIWLYFIAGTLGVGALANKVIPQESSEKLLAPFLSSALLLIVLLIGAGFRVYGINFGLPQNFHPDEVPKYNAIMRMYSDGTLNPRYFLHPSLLLYLAYGLAYLLYIIGIFAEFSQGIIISGRIVSTTAGIISIWLVYAIAQKLFNRKVALWSSLILAVSPLHITCSRYLKEDSLLTCLVLATTYLTTLAVKEDRKAYLLWGGFFAGLSASVKYSGLLSLGIVASAPWLASGQVLPARSWLITTVYSMMLFPVGFLIATPYSLIDLQKFIKDSSYEKRHMEKGHTATIDAWSQYWVYYLSRCIVPGLSWPIVLIAGCALGAATRARNIALLWIAYLVLVFYLPSEYVKSKPAPQPDRYIMPCLPFLAILAGWGMKRFLSFANGVLIIVIICSYPFKRSYELARDIKYDTRDKMVKWIEANIPKGEGILVDWPVYSPNLDQSQYKITFLERARILEELEPRNLRASGYKYLILSSFFYGRYFSQPNVEPAARERIRNVFRRFPSIHIEQADSGSYGFHNPTITLLDLSK